MRPMRLLTTRKSLDPLAARSPRLQRQGLFLRRNT